MSKVMQVLGIVLAIILLHGCNYRLESTTTFALPEGNIERGQELFSNLQCTACHNVQGLEFPSAEVEAPYNYVLGGSVTRVKTYQELVTSIINPSHKLAPRFQLDQARATGDSPMTNYNDVITVTDLIDLVSFLHTRYEAIPRPRYHYTPYTYTE